MTPSVTIRWSLQRDGKAMRVIDFVDALPRSPVGKVLKRSLRDRYWTNRDRAVN